MESSVPNVLGQLLGLLCCVGALVAPILIALYLITRKRPDAPAAPTPAATAKPAGAKPSGETDAFTVPTPDADWATRRFPDLGLALSTPPGVTADVVAGEVRVTLASGHNYRVKPGDLAFLVAKRREWLEATPHRTEKRVLLAAPDAFVYTAREGDLPDVSLVAGKTVGATTWVVETHGARVEHADTAADVDRNLSLADRSRLDAAKRDLAAAFLRGEPADGPAVRALMDTVAELTRKGAPKSPPPARVTSMTPAECSQAVALVRSLRPA